MVLVIWHHKEEAVLLHMIIINKGLLGKEKKKGILSIPTVFLSSLILGNGANLEIQKKIRCLVTKKIRKGMGEGGNSIEFSLNTILKNKSTYLNYELFSP